MMELLVVLRLPKFTRLHALDASPRSWSCRTNVSMTMQIYSNNNNDALQGLTLLLLLSELLRQIGATTKYQVLPSCRIPC